MKTDEYWMEIALAEARIGYYENEVPIGAAVVYEDELISKAHNKIMQLNDPTMHAEIIAIQDAAKYLGVKRLVGATIYVTLEPCIMCAGAMILARFKRLVFSAFSDKSGACGSIYNILTDKKLNHKIEVISGIKSKESQELLQSFFKKIRKEKELVF